MPPKREPLPFLPVSVGQKVNKEKVEVVGAEPPSPKRFFVKCHCFGCTVSVNTHVRGFAPQ